VIRRGRGVRVEQDELRPQPLRLDDSRLAISRLADNLESTGLEQRAGILTNALVVVRNSRDIAHHWRSRESRLSTRESRQRGPGGAEALRL
jgi:hypothetical protein